MSKRIPRNAITFNLRRITKGRYWITPDPRENLELERYQVRRGRQELIGWALITPGVHGSFQCFECGTCGAQMWDANAFEIHVEAHSESGTLAPRSEYRRRPPPTLRTLDEPDPMLPSAQLYFRIHRDPGSGEGQATIAWRVAEGERHTRSVTANHSTSPPGLEAWAFLTALQVLGRGMNVTVYTSSDHVKKWYTGEYEQFQPDIKTTMTAANRIARQRDLRIVSFVKAK